MTEITKRQFLRGLAGLGVTVSAGLSLLSPLSCFPREETPEPTPLLPTVVPSSVPSLYPLEGRVIAKDHDMYIVDCTDGSLAMFYESQIASLKDEHGILPQIYLGSQVVGNTLETPGCQEDLIEFESLESYLPYEDPFLFSGYGLVLHVQKIDEPDFIFKCGIDVEGIVYDYLFNPIFGSTVNGVNYQIFFSQPHLDEISPSKTLDQQVAELKAGLEGWQIVSYGIATVQGMGVFLFIDPGIVGLRYGIDSLPSQIASIEKRVTCAYARKPAFPAVSCPVLEIQTSQLV